VGFLPRPTGARRSNKTRSARKRVQVSCSPPHDDGPEYFAHHGTKLQATGPLRGDADGGEISLRVLYASRHRGSC